MQKIILICLILLTSWCEGQMMSNNTMFHGGARMTGIDEIVALGNSITVGQNASPISNSYINRFDTNWGLATVTNLAVGARGVHVAINQYKNDTYNRKTTIVNAMLGLNDMKRAGTNSKTLAKVISGHKYFFNKYAASVAALGSGGSVTRTGTNFYTNATGYKQYGSQGEVSFSFGSPIDSEWTYTVSDYPGFGFSVMASNGIALVTDAAMEVYVDGVLVETINLNEQLDGISDGVTANSIGVCSRYYFTPTPGSHTLKLKRTTTDYVIVDQFFAYHHPSELGPLLFWEIPYNTTAGYAGVPNLGSVAISDSYSAQIKAVQQELRNAGYPVYYVPTNAGTSFTPGYNLTTGCDTDGVHPTNTGHLQIYTLMQSLMDRR